MTTKTLTPPKPVVRDEFYEAALAWAQEFTEGLEELPAGTTAKAADCALGRATGLWMTHGDAMEPRYPHRLIVLPPKVSEFVKRFDSGHYPDLIER